MTDGNPNEEQPKTPAIGGGFFQPTHKPVTFDPPAPKDEPDSKIVQMDDADEKQRVPKVFDELLDGIMAEAVEIGEAVEAMSSPLGIVSYLTSAIVPFIENMEDDSPEAKEALVSAKRLSAMINRMKDAAEKKAQAE